MIVGAGPVGLLTAIELSLGDVRVLVLERLAAPSMASKALGIGPLGSEALKSRGMTAAIAAAAQTDWRKRFVAGTVRRTFSTCSGRNRF